jgi:transposase
MLVVETIAKIRRAARVQGKSIKEICREMKVSRKVVREVLRSEKTAFEYERRVQPLPKIGPVKEALDRLLAGNAAKSARERLSLTRIFEEIRRLGYDGGYDAIRRYARIWREERATSVASAYVPLSFAPGEAYQGHGVETVETSSVWHQARTLRLERLPDRSDHGPRDGDEPWRGRCTGRAASRAIPRSSGPEPAA